MGAVAQGFCRSISDWMTWDMIPMGTRDTSSGALFHIPSVWAFAHIYRIPQHAPCLLSTLSLCMYYTVVLPDLAYFTALT